MKKTYIYELSMKNEYNMAFIGKKCQKAGYFGRSGGLSTAIFLSRDKSDYKKDIHCNP